MGKMTMQDKLDNALITLIDSDRMEDLYILARYTYMIHPIMSDEDYDELEKALIELNSTKLTLFFARTYDDDPTPVSLLQEFNLLELINEQLPPEQYADAYAYMNTKKSLSISAVTELSEVWEYIQSVKKFKLRVSLKINGNNTKTLYRKASSLNRLRMLLSLSRGRATNSIDLTKNMSRIMKQEFDGENEVIIYSETYVQPTYLDTLVEKYGSGYVSPKSAALSLTRRDHDREDYEHLKTLVFSSEGLPFKTGSEGLEFLRGQGFDIVPYTLIEPEEIPETFEDFEPWLEKVMNTFEDIREVIPSDGVVFDVDSIDFQEDIVGKYSSRNIAVKMYGWRFKYYVGTVKSIVIEPRRVFSCCKVEIEPMVTDDNCKAKIIDTYNPRILIQQGLSVGSKVLFMRDSEAINKLVRLDEDTSIEELEAKGLLSKGIIKSAENEIKLSDITSSNVILEEIDEVIRNL